MNLMPYHLESPGCLCPILTGPTFFYLREASYPGVAGVLLPSCGAFATWVNLSKTLPFLLFDAQRYRNRIASVYSRMLPRVILALLLGNTFLGQRYHLR